MMNLKELLDPQTMEIRRDGNEYQARIYQTQTVRPLLDVVVASFTVSPLVQAVARMRAYQQRYFVTKDAGLMNLAKIEEDKVDRYLHLLGIGKATENPKQQKLFTETQNKYYHEKGPGGYTGD